MNKLKTNKKINYYFTFDYLPTSKQANLITKKLFEELSLNKGEERKLSTTNLNKKYKSFCLFLGTLISRTQLEGHKHCYKSLMRETFSGEKVSYRHFVSFKNALVNAGLIKHEKGKFHEDEDEWHFQTEEEKKKNIKPYKYYSASKFFMTDTLVKVCNDNGLNQANWNEHFLKLKPDCFIEARYPNQKYKGQKLRGRKVNRQKILSNPIASQQQAVMSELNEFLFKQNMEGAAFTGLKRVFSDYSDNGSYQFNRGGRLYAFGTEHYQRMSKDERALIKINGEETVEIDIHASFLTLIHKLLNIPLPNRSNLYEITDYPRFIVKTWINQTISNGGKKNKWGKGTLAEFKKELGGSKFPTAKEIGEEVLKYYPFLGDLKATGLDWQTLHYMELETLLKTLQELQKLDIQAYPIHDSIIVKKSDFEAGNETFEKNFAVSCMEVLSKNFSGANNLR